VESWLLADPHVYELISSDERYSIHQPFEAYVVDNAFHFFNSKVIAALSRKKVEATYDPNRAAMLSPSLRSFCKTIDHVRGIASHDFEFALPGAVLANLVLEYYPPELPLYRALDGSIYTGRDMAREIGEGTSIGRKYSSDLLRVCRDLLARQAQKSRTAR
jgi:hypothetical protein